MSDRTIVVSCEEMNAPTDYIRQYSACLSSFVSYQGAWHMNGAVHFLNMTSEQWENFRREAPDYMPEHATTFAAEMMLEKTNDCSIFFFKNLKEMKLFLEDKLDCRNEQFPVNKIDTQYPMMFIDASEPKCCQQFAFGYTRCVAHPDNPYYDERFAREEVVNMLWDSSTITTGAVHYLIEHNYLPEVPSCSALRSSGNNPNVKDDLRFLLRYMCKEHY